MFDKAVSLGRFGRFARRVSAIMPIGAIALLVLLTPFFAGGLRSAEPMSTPNIVVILADDFGYGDCGCYNPASKIPTPHIDRLAKEGMRFTDAHSPSAVCSPTRYGLLTGRYAWRTKLRRGVLGPYDPPLIAADRLTLPSMLKPLGYHSACIGKWHLGWDWPEKTGKDLFGKAIPGGPTARGFDTYFGTDVPNYPPYAFIKDDRLTADPTAEFSGKDNEIIVNRGGVMVPGWKFDAILPTLVEKAEEYVAERAKSGKPFLLYMPLTSPHEPISPSARFRGKSGISPLADFFMETDAAVGAVLDAMDRHRIADKTIVVFLTDNGHAKYTGLPALEKAGHAVSGPLRGHKTDIYEGGHRVPFIVRYPGVVPAGSVSDRTICHVDLMATVAELTGAKLPDTAAEDSFSFLTDLRGKPKESAVRAPVVHQAANGVLAVRSGRWKLIVGGDPGAERNELYDLSADLGEKNNRSDADPKVVAELTSALESLIAKGRSRPGPDAKNDVAVPLRVTQPNPKPKAKEKAKEKASPPAPQSDDL